jgi:hypothetical protein
MGAAEILNYPITKWILTAINILMIFVISFYMGVNSSPEDAYKEFNRHMKAIIPCAVILMISWWGLTSSMFAANSASAIYYIYFMLAFLLAMGFVALSVATISRRQMGSA